MAGHAAEAEAAAAGAEPAKAAIELGMDGKKHGDPCILSFFFVCSSFLFPTVLPSLSSGSVHPSSAALLFVVIALSLLVPLFFCTMS